jgi:hypothetical protein
MNSGPYRRSRWRYTCVTNRMGRKKLVSNLARRFISELASHISLTRKRPTVGVGRCSFFRCSDLSPACQLDTMTRTNSLCPKSYNRPPILPLYPNMKDLGQRLQSILGRVRSQLCQIPAHGIPEAGKRAFSKCC